MTMLRYELSAGVEALSKRDKDAEMSVFEVV